MTIATARPEHLAPIVNILNQSAETYENARTGPVSPASQQAWFESHTPDRYPIWVAMLDDTVIGWCALSPWRAGRGALRPVAELTYYVDREHRRQGVGSALVQHALMQAPTLGVGTLLAIGLETNAGSAALLTRAGFHRWGFLPAVARFEHRTVGQWIYGLHLDP